MTQCFRYRPAVLAATILLFLVNIAAAPLTQSDLDELKTVLESGRYADAERRSRVLLEQRDRQEIDASLEMCRILDILVESLWRGGKSAAPETLQFAQQAIRIKEERLGPTHVEVASSLDNLAHVLLARGRHDEARRQFERGLEVREASLGPDHPDVAHSLNQLGWVLYTLGDLAAAKVDGERSVDIRRRKLTRDDPDLASSLNNLAVYLKTSGDLEGARVHYEQALGIYETAFGVEHPKLANTVNNLAVVYKVQGDYASAIPMYERAIKIGRATRGPDHPSVAQSMINLAALRLRMGNFAESRTLYEQALRIVEQRRGPEHPQVALVLNNLGWLLLETGDVEAARGALERALAIRENSLGQDHPLVSRVLNNLGVLKLRAGEVGAALDLFERSSLIVQERLGEEHPETAGVAEQLGDVFRLKGDHEIARRHFERALEVYESTLGSEHPRVAGCLLELSRLLLDVSEPRAAFDAALEADRLGRQHLQLTARVLPQRQALAYASARPAGQDLALSALAGDQAGRTATSRAWDAVIRSRALVFDEMRTRHHALSQAEGPARRLARSSERLANLLVRGPGDQSLDQYRALMREATSSRDAAERELAQSSLIFRRNRVATQYGWTDVIEALPDRSALVGYVLYDRRLGGKSVPTYMALVQRDDAAEPIAIQLGEQEKIDAAVLDWRREIEAARKVFPSKRRAAELRYGRSSDELRRLVWDPLWPHLRESQRLFVVPDGTLQLVNLSTLTDRDGTYLIESSPPIHYLSTERDLVGREAASTTDANLLVVGGVAFGSGAAPTAGGTAARCRGLDSLQFQSLPGSAREIDAVVSAWSEGFPEDSPPPVTQLRGTAATEEAFKRLVPGHRVVHVASHGFFVNERCDPQRADGDRAAVLELAPAIDEFRVVLSGLAFAGANRRREDGDGVLMAEEIAAIDLSGTDWVVLSGCDTGLGTIHADEGVLGLRRAFRIAGAGTLIMSLWPIEDTSTRGWMRRLYIGRSAGLSSAEAVHHAGLGALQARRAERQSTHPFYWGAFIAVGDWR